MTEAEDTAYRAPRPFPSIWVAIVAIVIYFVMQLLAGVIAGGIAIAQNATGDLTPDQIAALAMDMKIMALPTIWSLVASSVITLGGLWYYLSREGRANSIWLDRWSQMSLHSTLIWAVGLVGTGLLFNYAYETYAVPNVKMQEQLRALFAAIPDTTGNNILLFVAAAILAPVLEEILFRGLLQKSLANLMPLWAAIFISALVFAAMHLDFYAMPGLFVLGAIFGYLYHKTGSLRTNIVLHMVNNAAALAFGG